MKARKMASERRAYRAGKHAEPLAQKREPRSARGPSGTGLSPRVNAAPRSHVNIGLLASYTILGNCS